MSSYLPVPFVSPSPQAEMMGGPVLLALIENMRADEIQPILQKYGLDSIGVHSWYPMQQFLDLFKDIVEKKENVNEELVAIGVAGLDTVITLLSPQLDSVESALLFIDQVTPLQCRNIPIGFGAPAQIVGPKHALLFNNMPFDHRTLYGIAWAMVNRYKLPDETFVIKVLPPEEGKPTTFDIRWGTLEELEEDS